MLWSANVWYGASHIFSLPDIDPKCVCVYVLLLLLLCSCYPQQTGLRSALCGLLRWSLNMISFQGKRFVFSARLAQRATLFLSPYPTLTPHSRFLVTWLTGAQTSGAFFIFLSDSQENGIPFSPPPSSPNLNTVHSNIQILRFHFSQTVACNSLQCSLSSREEGKPTDIFSPLWRFPG